MRSGQLLLKGNIFRIVKCQAEIFEQPAVQGQAVNISEETKNKETIMKKSTGIRELKDEELALVTGGSGEQIRAVIDGYLYYQKMHGRMTEAQAADFIKQPVKTQIKGLVQGAYELISVQNNRRHTS